MDKQKQIEEMAKEMCGVSRRSYELCGDCFGEKNNYIGCRGMAQFLSEKGWVKIPENAVVLTNEEYKRLQRRQESCKTCEEIASGMVKKARKETAEKFAERLKESGEIKAISIVKNGTLYPIYKAIVDRIDEIAKEFTEGTV